MVLIIVVLSDVTTALLAVVLLVMTDDGWVETGWTIDSEDDVEGGYLGWMLGMYKTNRRRMNGG